MTALGEEVAALRESLVEVRVQVARRWAARRRAAVPTSLELEKSVRRLGYRALRAAAGLGSSRAAGREGAGLVALGAPGPRPAGTSAGWPKRSSGAERAAGAVLLAVSLLAVPLADAGHWVAAPAAGAALLAACVIGMALGMRLLLKG
jgi:hypothetical protein